jgi:hypothetical protein
MSGRIFAMTPWFPIGGAAPFRDRSTRTILREAPDLSLSIFMNMSSGH